MEQLSNSGLISRVFYTSANGIPLQSEVNEKKFRLIYLDIGLMQNANKVNPNIILTDNVWQVNEGSLAEQLVGQELLVTENFYENTILYFWEKEDPGSTREVDYVKQINSQIVPIEVKAGKDGHLKSLHAFMKEKKIDLGVTISQAPLAFKDKILNLPFYLIGEIARIINEL